MGMIRVGMGGYVFVEGEGDGEFAAAEVGLVEGLAFAGTAFEHCEVFTGGFVDECAGGGGGFFADLVAPDVGEADGVDDGDAVDEPSDLGFPVDGFEDATGGGGGDNVVGEALDLHFRAGEEGEFTGDVEFDGGGHWGN